jgi:glucosamine-6-phosphate deaminase
VGIGENAHMVFNDPPADFRTNAPFIRVSLDQKCPEQQVDEGWFNRIAYVSLEAITMNMKQIRKSKSIICTVLEDRKATAVKEAIEGPLQSLSGISPQKTSKHSLFF